MGGDPETVTHGVGHVPHVILIIRHVNAAIEVQKRPS